MEKLEFFFPKMIKISWIYMKRISTKFPNFFGVGEITLIVSGFKDMVPLMAIGVGGAAGVIRYLSFSLRLENSQEDSNFLQSYTWHLSQKNRNDEKSVEHSLPLPNTTKENLKAKYPKKKSQKLAFFQIFHVK